VKSKKIAIAFDVGLDQRLITRLMSLNKAELVVIPKVMAISKDVFNPDKKEDIKTYKARHLKQVQVTMRAVDGIILAGNKYDINPAHYREKNVHPETQKLINPNPRDIRFDVEKEMFFCAIKRELPIVAICAGMQLINVVLGGTLIQHLPDILNSITHRHPRKLDKKEIENWENIFKNQISVNDAKNIYTEHPHCIDIKPNSTLGKLYKAFNPHVDLNNVRELSMHHQGCFKENLSQRLSVVATSSDGLIEAVELIDYPSLFVATQFHFEYNVGNIANGIFKALVS